jgi:hypothetical protein
MLFVNCLVTKKDESIRKLLFNSLLHFSLVAGKVRRGEDIIFIIFYLCFIKYVGILDYMIKRVALCVGES